MELTHILRNFLDAHPAGDIPFQSGFLPYIERYCDECAIPFLMQRTTELILHIIHPPLLWSDS